MLAPAAPPPPQTAGEEWQAAWTVVIAGAVGIGGTALYFYSLGLMIAPLHKAFGWSETQITIAPIIISALNLLMAARVGALADRLGVRKVALPGYIAFCIAFAGLGLAGPSIWSWYALWTLLALVFPFTAPSLWAMAVVSRFERARALALSVALCGTAAVAMVTPLLESWLIATGSWRIAYFALGGLALLGLPIAARWLYSAREVGLTAAAGGGQAGEEEGSAAI
jgi:MFS family permease